MKKKFAVLTFLLLSAFVLNAQPNKTSADESIAQSLHGHGSMNVVLAVIGIILGGLFIFLWRIDRKVAKLEKDLNTK